jgi:hypothetical protein
METFESLIPLAIELVSAMLALAVAGSTLKLFHVVRRNYLLGLPVGFSFLALGYLSSSASYALPALTDPLTWFALLCQTYGFAFVAVTYLLKKNSRLGRVAQWLISIMIILAVIAATIIVVQTERIPSYQTFDEAFSITNIFLLSYILIELYPKVRADRHGIGTAILASYAVLAVSQYSYLLWRLDGGFWSFSMAHVLEFIGLAILVANLVEDLRR